MKLMIFDTETTGLPKDRTVTKDNYHLWPRIVQLSYLIYDTDNNDINLIYDKIVKVDINISPESVKIHKITNEISNSKGVDIESVIFMFFHSLSYVDKLVGHNITFDLNMIKAELYRKLATYNDNDSKCVHHYLKMLDTINISCTMRENKKLCNIVRTNASGEYLKYPTLMELHNHLFNTTPNNLHNSLNDILITLRCLVMINTNKDIYKMEHLRKYYDDIL